MDVEDVAVSSEGVWLATVAVGARLLPLEVVHWVSGMWTKVGSNRMVFPAELDHSAKLTAQRMMENMGVLEGAVDWKEKCLLASA